MNIDVEGIPIPQGSKVVMRGRLIDVRSKDLKAWRTAIAVRARSERHDLLLEAVEVSLVFTLPKPKTVKRLLPSVKPDVDKLARAVLDALTGVAYKDDAQVTDLIVRKRYRQPAESIGVSIRVRAL